MAHRPPGSRGFTLIELMVALFAMSLMAVLSWRGLDGMVRAQQSTQTRADEVQVLQVGLAQWSADLDAIVQLPQTTALDWNGRVLRMTRRAPAAAPDGVVVVGWGRRVSANGVPRWMRWQSPPVTTRGEVEDAWRRADAWAQASSSDGGASEVSVTGLQDWQVFYFRADAWTNPLSSDATQAPTTPGRPPAQPPVAGTRTAQLPDGVRIVLTLSPGQAITGELTRDWVRPTVGGGKS
jgi:general secretion pathway protein J